MRHLLCCIYILIIGVTLPVCAESVQSVGEVSSSPKVLIINSYRVETDWSNSLVRGIEERLFDVYPGIQVHTGALNVDVATVSSTPGFNLRSVMWSFFEEDSRHVWKNNGKNDALLLSEAHPDVIVLVGDDAILFYQQFGTELGEWRNVPLVLCSVSETIVKGNWGDDMLLDTDSIVPIENRRRNENFIPKSLDKKGVDKELSMKPGKLNGVDGYYVDVDYQITGVKSTLPVRENLELMHRLMPGLKEIVWVDDTYFGSVYARKQVEKGIKDMLPAVSFRTLTHDMTNTDSIFDEMLESVPHRAYLTYSWNISDRYSRQSNEQIESLFRNYSTVPLFSLTERDAHERFWLGGYYRSRMEYIDKTVSLVGRILKGESANSIPFETVSGGRIVLDEPLLIKADLLEEAHSLEKSHAIENVEYRNVLPSFYKENEKRILVGVIVGTILIGMCIFWLRRYRYSRKVHREYIRFKSLYTRLQLIYMHTGIDFALYDKNGDCLFRIMNGREYVVGANDNKGPFSDNLFENPDLNKELKGLIREMHPVNVEVILNSTGRLASADAERQIYQFMVKPLNDPNYESAQYIALAFDLNQIIRERQERERFESISRFASDSSQMGIGFYNIDTGVGSGTNYWYYNLNESLAPNQLPEYKNVVPEDRELLLEFREKARAGKIKEHFDRDIRVIGDDGEEHWITENIFLNENDNRMLIEFNLNIDEQKKSEDILIKAKEKAEQAIVETEEFLNSINHEIRTPLNGIVGFSAILAASEDDEERKDHVSIIRKNNTLLTMLVDDIIQLSSIDGGQTCFTRDAVSVTEVFGKVMKAGYSDLYGKDLSIITDIEGENPVVYTDRYSLYRLMMNLVSNAIKFTQSGSVTLGYRKSGRDYYFYVKDTGLGISADYQKRVFKRFDKLDSYMQGTGLGLAVCKSLVEHLKGEIGVESELGKGSTFWFTLPPLSE